LACHELDAGSDQTVKTQNCPYPDQTLTKAKALIKAQDLKKARKQERVHEHAI
jgi:hypothetical protein